VNFFTEKNMSQDDVTRIKVNKQFVGIIGLKQVTEEMAPEYAEKPDAEVQHALVTRISKKNYIPNHAKEEYGRAFLREFNKSLGRPYEEEASEGLEIKVLGPGCARCDKLEREAMEVMSEMELPGDLEHIRDIKEIGRYGVMGTPALVINGKVVCVGEVPSKEKIKEWLGGGCELTRVTAKTDPKGV
jgi:small redox-active disulfide protein 2